MRSAYAGTLTVALVGLVALAVFTIGIWASPSPVESAERFIAPLMTSVGLLLVGVLSNAVVIVVAWHDKGVASEDAS